MFINSFIEAYKAPIFIALRDLNIKYANLELHLRENILQNKLSPSDEYLNKLLDEGNFLFFLDGYDEIKSSEKHEITKNIEAFIDKYPKNSYILTSRPYSNIEYFKCFHNYTIADLSSEDRVKFIQQQIKDTKLSSKIIESISEAQVGYINSFLKNSLLLTLYIMTYSKNSSIPKSKYIFYRRVFDVLYEEHDSATKIGFEREIKTQLSQETLEEILRLFSFLSYFDNHFDFDKNYVSEKLTTIKTKHQEIKFKNNDFIEDMKLSIGLWVEDSGIYSFAHRSLQEYFASVFVANITNTENKIKVYEKIVTSACNHNFDIKNFLSLCYEMDYQFFIQYYTMPIIEKIRRLFMDTDNNLNYEFSYINDGFSKRTTMVTSDLMLLFETWYLPNKIFINHWQKVVDIFENSSNHKDFDKFVKVSENSHNNQEMYYLPKGKDINPEYIEFLHAIKMDELLIEIVKELDDIKENLEKEINAKKSIEDDFITMI